MTEKQKDKPKGNASTNASTQGFWGSVYDAITSPFVMLAELIAAILD